MALKAETGHLWAMKNHLLVANYLLH